MNQGVVKQNSCSTELQRIITASCNEFAAVTLDAADEGCTSKTLQAEAVQSRSPLINYR